MVDTQLSSCFSNPAFPRRSTPAKFRRISDEIAPRFGNMRRFVAIPTARSLLYVHISPYGLDSSSMLLAPKHTVPVCLFELHNGGEASDVCASDRAPGNPLRPASTEHHHRKSRARTAADAYVGPDRYCIENKIVRYLVVAFAGFVERQQSPFSPCFVPCMVGAAV